MSQVAVIAKITAQDGKRADVVAGMGQMMEAVESEEGTLSYVLMQDASDANVIWVYELYTDQAAFDAHSGSDAMAALIGTIGGLLGAAPELTFATPVGSKGS